jgi:hypothetical protein
MRAITCAELLEQGDVAVRERDMKVFVRVALALSARIGDPVNGQLRALARSSRRDGRASVLAWSIVRAAVVDRIAIAGI